MRKKLFAGLLLGAFIITGILVGVSRAYIYNPDGVGTGSGGGASTSTANTWSALQTFSAGLSFTSASGTNLDLTGRITAAVSSTISGGLAVNTSTQNGSLNVQGSTFTSGLSVGTTTVPNNNQLVSPNISSTAITINGNPAAIVPASTVTAYAPTSVFWNNNVNTGTSTLNLAAIQVPYKTTFTGIGFAIWDISTGTTTVGIYNSAGTLLASSTAQAIPGTFATVTEPFQTPYTGNPGVYYVALLESNASTHFIGVIDFAKTAATSTSNGLIPSSFNTAILTGNGITPAMATY